MATVNPQDTTEFQEFETRDIQTQKDIRTGRLVESVRLGLTVLALLSGITIVATSGDSLFVYNTTHLSEDFFLALWPNDFDHRPTIALVVCGTTVLLSSAVSLISSKVQSIRSKALVHSSISFLAPTVGVIAGLIGTSFFYGVNASNTVSSLQSWACQWSDISMDVKPHWGTLCRESKVALYLTVMVIPLEVLVLATAAWGVKGGKNQTIFHERKGSPTLS